MLPFAVDARLALSVQGRGRGDPTFRVDEAGAIWRTSLTPDRPATIRVVPGGAVHPRGPRRSTPLSTPGKGGRPPFHPPPQGNGQTPLDGVPPEPPDASITRVWASAWGPGAGWMLDALPGCLVCDDDAAGFDPGDHPVIRDA